MMTLSRSVTIEECPWLEKDLPKGLEVHEYHGLTYGCIQHTGIAVTIKKDENPFFEIPMDALYNE